MPDTLSIDDNLLTSFEKVFRNLYPRLCDFATRFLEHADEAEDIVQDAFIVFLEQREHVYNNPIAIKNYLYTSVRYACLNKHRHGKVIQRYQENYKLENQEEKSTIDAIIHSEIMGEIHSTLKTLPPGCAEIFKLGYFNDLSNQEVSELLNISVSTVKSQKKRALDLLKKKLKPETLSCLLPFLLG